MVSCAEDKREQGKKPAEKASRRLTEDIWKGEGLVRCGEDPEKVSLSCVVTVDTSCDTDVRVSDCCYFSRQSGYIWR